jgi:hypothetical protein
MSANTVARLKITLDVVKPTVLRRIEVPLDIRFDRLHLTIQAALGWTNSHLYEIRAGDVRWSTLYPEADWPEDFLDARSIVICSGAIRREHGCFCQRQHGAKVGLLYAELDSMSIH